jgi:hypothetical protein
MANMSTAPSTIRIGNAQAFWGDRCDAAAELVAQAPDLDFLTMDYLAEVSMSILAVQRERDPAAGFPRDFVDVVASLAPYWAAGGKCRLIANAGGLNPRSCAEACRAALEAAGCRPMKLAVVAGDNVLPLLQQEPENLDYRNLDTAASLAGVVDRLVTANAYIGAAPIAEALRGGADIVITGRVADPSLVVGACLAHFGWNETDWQRLAGATVAGHLIECGTQVTGGICTDWLAIPDPAHIGFPIVEVSDDGSCVVTKPPGTGGLVNQWTVKEQLLYEIGDPASYLSPDVAVSFLTIDVEELGPNRVRVSGATGRERPPTLKVSATFRDGYRAAGTLTILGADAVAKARRCGEIVLERLRETGHAVRNSVVECFGGAAGPPAAVLRIAVDAESKGTVERFAKELMPLITAGPQGTTGYAEGRPRVHPVFRYWPCLVDRALVTPRVEWLETAATKSRADSPPRRPVAASASSMVPRSAAATGTLRDIALARSGDKGTSANIGVIARNSGDYPFLVDWLTADRVADYFQSDGVDDVVRYELPNLGALNFVVRGVLRQSLRTDAQGKGLGQRLLDLPIPR